MRIAVLTTFVELLDAFSLCGVVATQLKALLQLGHDVTFVACDGCTPRGVFAHPFLRQQRLPVVHIADEHDVVERERNFRAGVEAIKVRLRPLLAATDLAITHDLIYLSHHLAYNVACREVAAEFPRVRWLHWIHSAPEPHRAYAHSDPRWARFAPFPNARLVYPNAWDIPRLARQFAVPEQSISVVPHALDYETLFAFHPLSRALLECYDLYSPELVALYPIRMDRGKQPEKLVRFFAALKQAGRSICLLIVNFHSTGERFLAYRDEIKREARALGLTGEEVIFTNEIGSLPGIDTEQCARIRVEFPQRVVTDLFHLTNIYVHPSASETYSLVCQEAAATGNLLVLNDDFPPMRDLYGSAALYFKFSSTLFTTTHTPSEAAYYAECARRLLAHLATEKTIAQKDRLRRTRNLPYVARTYLEPLLYAETAVPA
jgi:glycosyltransferase involved in cell wall biosynthesis